MIASDFLEDRIRAPSRAHRYLAALAGSKILRCIGVFIIADLLKLVHVVQLLFLMKLVSSIILLFVQKPFTSGRKLTKTQLITIGQCSLLNTAVLVLWLYGITLCGPFRSILLFEHSATVVITCLAALIYSTGGPSKIRGAVFFLLGFVTCILLDRDMPHSHSETHGHHSGLNHIFYHVMNWFGLSDHKGGVLLLLIALLLKAAHEQLCKKIGTELGGVKKSNAVSSMMSTVLIFPWTCFTLLTQETQVVSFLEFGIATAFVAVLLFVADFYLERLCSGRLDNIDVCRIIPLTMIFMGLLISQIWPTDPTGTDRVDMTKFQDEHKNMPGFWTFLLHGQGLGSGDRHGLSGGVILSMAFFVIATFSLTAHSNPKGRAAQFVGYSSSGLPLYVHGEDFLQKTSHSISAFAKNTLKQILSSSDSRRIFYFLCANLAFTFVEFAYGMLTNSLGLISDAFHMLFDCSALVMGLVAAVMSTWQPSRVFSYGYGRLETLSGFINALFLCTIAFFIFTEAMERIWEPPEVHTEKLLTVSVAGLVVNLFGMFAFSGSHSHGGGSSHSHGHSHGGGGSHGHSHDKPKSQHTHSHGHSHGGGNANMQGVFLHVLADTLGSVGVIISTLLIKYFGWHIADPICSLCLSALITASVIPLLKGSASVLLQRTPPEAEEEFKDALQKVLMLDGVISYSDAHLWQIKEEALVGSVHVQVANDVTQQKILKQILGIIRTAGVKNVTVQIEKDSFYQHITTLCPSYPVAPKVRRTMSAIQPTLMVNAI